MSLLNEDFRLTEEAQDDALKGMETDLSSLLVDIQIPRDIQARIALLGYGGVRVFSRVEDTAEKVRDFVKTDLGVDPSKSPQHRSMAARLVTAWEAARKRVEHRHVHEAEQRVNDLPKILPKSQHLELARAYAQVHRALKDAEAPAASYVEWRLEQFEDGELIPETLKQVVNKAEASADPWGGCAIQSDGTIKLRRGKVESSMPAKSEELRTKFKVLANHWEFVRLKNPQHPVFKGYTLHMWSDYVDWLLGEEVFENTVKDPQGAVQYRPSWHILLDYEFHVRKHMLHFVNTESKSLYDALTLARDHSPTFIKYFSTPVALAAGAAAASGVLGGAPSGRATRRSRSPRRDRPSEGTEQDTEKWKGDHHRGKGDGGRKGKGSGKQNRRTGWKSTSTNVTPDGRLKCFAFQRGKCQGGCGKVHVCLICNGDHPMTQCHRKPKAPPPPGSAASASDAAGRPAQPVLQVQ